MLYFSKTTNGFYDNQVNDVIPADAVEITQQKHQELLAAQSNGKAIKSDKKGNPVAAERILAPLTPEESINVYEAAAKLALDNLAKSWGYDSMVEAASYVNSTNPQYKAEAEALVLWRDQTWDKIYQIEAGELPTTTTKFLALLPKAPAKPTA